MAALTVDGISDEVMTLLRSRALERGTDVQTVVRELIHLGVSLELARRQGTDLDFDALVDAVTQPRPADVLDCFGGFDTADLDQLWG